jgi:hypothetical protein
MRITLHLPGHQPAILQSMPLKFEINYNEDALEIVKEL